MKEKKMIKPDKLKKGDGRTIRKNGSPRFWLLQLNTGVCDTYLPPPPPHPTHRKGEGKLDEKGLFLISSYGVTDDF